MWELKRVSSLNKDSKSPFNSLNLTDKNHIQEFQDFLFEIYGAKKSKKTIIKNPKHKIQGIEHFIFGWSDDKTLKDDLGNPLDIIVHMKEDKTIWEPYLEYIMRKAIMDRNPHTIQFGYIDGRVSHLGPIESTKFLLNANKFSGYKIWIEYS